MPGGAISCTQGLPNNIVQMFEARPAGPAAAGGQAEDAKHTGIGSYVPHFLPSEQVSDNSGATLTGDVWSASPSCCRAACTTQSANTPHSREGPPPRAFRPPSACRPNADDRMSQDDYKPIIRGPQGAPQAACRSVRDHDSKLAEEKESTSPPRTRTRRRTRSRPSSLGASRTRSTTQAETREWSDTVQ